MAGSEEQIALRCAMRFHAKGSATPDVTLTRLVRERVPGIPDLRIEAVPIRRLSVGQAELAALVPRHDRAEPKRLDGPLIAVQCDDKRLLIDGSNRRNHYLQARQPGPFELLLIPL